MINKAYHKPNNHKKFDYYIRACRDCDEIFKAQTQAQRYCEECLEKRIMERKRKSLETRTKNKLLKEKQDKQNE